jgi:TonB-dependent starch-binding outer membrane protein SusC
MMKRFSKTTVFLMRSTFIVALCICLCDALLIASPVVAQKLKETKISISFKGEPLDVCIKKIELKTDIQFAFNPAELSQVNTEKINFKKTSVQKILEWLVKGTDLSFSELGNKVVIYNTLSNTTTSISEKIPGYHQPIVAYYPPGIITGTILNEKGDPISSVTIKVKGTNRSVVSDEKGMFSINAEESDILVFSSIGYATKEIPVNKNTALAINLTTINTQLEDVVVIGYGSQKRKDVTGAIASLKGETLKNLPVRSVAEALQGRVAGVYVTNDNGAPGAGSDIIIRGPVNIRGAGPLYVIDGIPFTDAGNSFNMQDVENIEVIKDASAAAIYGSRAAAGVIIVTTKKGKAGKLQITANATVGSRKALKLPKLLSRDEFITARIANGNDADAFFGPESERSKLPNTNWFDYLYRNALEQNYNVSLAGGNEKSTYYMSANYNNQEGIHIDNFLKRYTIRINSDHKINSRLKVGQNFYLSTQNENAANPSNQGLLSYRTSPIMNVYDATNPIGGWGKTPAYYTGSNDVSQELSNYSRSNNYEANLAVYAELEILKGLKIRQNLAMKYSANDYYFYEYPWDWGYTQRTTTNFGKAYGKSLNYIGNTTISYTKKIKKHDFSLLAGYEAQKSINDNISGYAQNANGILSRDLGFVRQPLTTNTAIGTGDDLYRINSQFGRLTYSYDDKYLFNANIRRDGVSTSFGPNNKYGVFPSFSVGWKVINENFLRSSKIFSDLKLRASYGVLGNSTLPNFAFQTSYSAGYPAVLGPNGPIVNSFNIETKIANNDIQWENVTTTNIGADLAFFNNALTVSIDAYSRQTKKMLYSVPLPGSAGQGQTIEYNIGQMSNKGLEFLVNYTGKIGKDFTYSAGFNGAFNTNKLITLDPKAGGIIIDGQLNELYYEPATRTEPGQPLGQFYGWIADGIYQTDEEGAKGAQVFGDGYFPHAGDLIYRDLNKDGIIDNDDKAYIGNPWPKLTYGINLGLQYKGIDLSIFLAGIQGVDIYNAQESFDHVFYSDYNTTTDIFKSSLFNGGPVTNVPRSTYPLNDPTPRYDDDPNYNWKLVSSYHVKNGSFLRLKNIQLGYTFSDKLLKNVRVSSARIFVMANNLFTITKYNGYDPEIAGGVKSRGIDNSMDRYPTTRLFTVGLNVNF